MTHRGFSIWMLTAMLFVVAFGAAAQEKPLLSQAIREAIDTKGTEWAINHFANVFQTQKNRYAVDLEAVTKLGNDYAAKGNMEAAGAVTAISIPFIQDFMANQMSGQMSDQARQMVEKEEEIRKKEKAVRDEANKAKENPRVDYGEARTDLDRFSGLYGDPAETDQNRKLWVSVSCDGYLVVGALWGDASAWWMKSSGDKRFTYSDSFINLSIEFETDGAGGSTGMNHDLEFMPSPLKNQGPLPEGWEPCIDRPVR